MTICMRTVFDSWRLPVHPARRHVTWCALSALALVRIMVLPRRSRWCGGVSHAALAVGTACDLLSRERATRSPTASRGSMHEAFASIPPMRRDTLALGWCGDRDELEPREPLPGYAIAHTAVAAVIGVPRRRGAVPSGSRCWPTPGAGLLAERSALSRATQVRAPRSRRRRTKPTPPSSCHVSKIIRRRASQ